MSVKELQFILDLLLGPTFFELLHPCEIFLCFFLPDLLQLFYVLSHLGEESAELTESEKPVWEGGGGMMMIDEAEHLSDCCYF